MDVNHRRFDESIAPVPRYYTVVLMTSINSRPCRTRNYTTVLMTPINSTLKIVGAGDAGRHLETGFRLTHIRSPRGVLTRGSAPRLSLIVPREPSSAKFIRRQDSRPRVSVNSA